MKHLWITVVEEILRIGLSDRQLFYVCEVTGLEKSEVNELMRRAEVELKKIKENL